MAKSKIDKTLQKILETTSKAQLTSSSSKTSASLGDPNCEFCGGTGYLRSDVPVGHPNFGKLEICSCRRRDVTDQVRKRLFSLSHLDELKDLTFENFHPRGRGRGLGQTQAASIERAFNQANNYAKNLNGWLLFQGNYGCGKTHLAAAIANFAVSMGVPTLFLTVPDLLDMLRFSYNAEDTTFEQRFDEIRNAQLLVLDDFGTQNATNWAQEKLFQIINYRYINKFPLIITTNIGLAEIEPRIRSRLQDPELVTTVRIHAPDYRDPTNDIGYQELSSLDVLRRHTFTNFSLRRNEEGMSTDATKQLEEALNAAMDYAKDPDGWMIFVGPYGCGKTHLAAAIGNERVNQGMPPLFIVVPDLLDYLKATFNPKSFVNYDKRFEDIKTADLLILDDLGTQSQTPWAKEKLFQLLNYRYNAELPTVITFASDALNDIDPRIQSRITDPKISDYYSLVVPAYKSTETRRDKKKRKYRR